MDITVQELREKLRTGLPVILVDVREPWEHEEFNIGGWLIPVGRMLEEWELLKAYKEEEVVVYCRSGVRSATAQAILQAQGFKHVRNLIGGMIAWRSTFGDVPK
ncbi:MAG: rhodanese-like domain-containing protein [Saprospiraceae bacterium]|nr:rhodanese-like domain-containing protein [Saprospiraceae bacterium]MDW8483993.1 rhodanese-like domain-containing protein [Saprospiraceae bacterium]